MPSSLSSLLLLESTRQWLSIMFLEIWGSESQDEKETWSLLLNITQMLRVCLSRCSLWCPLYLVQVIVDLHPVYHLLLQSTSCMGQASPLELFWNTPAAMASGKSIQAILLVMKMVRGSTLSSVSVSIHLDSHLYLPCSGSACRNVINPSSWKKNIWTKLY